MAQAFLLDRLNPEWKTTILKGNVFLEDMLSKALTNRSVASGPHGTGKASEPLSNILRLPKK